MKHKKCGGKFVRIKKDEGETVYQCDKCSAIRIMYKRIATSGNLKKGG